MNSNRKILSILLAVLVAVVGSGTWAFAQTDTGIASIGFSTGGITYVPYGLSGVEGGLGLSFGTHAIGTGSVTETYRSLNKAGYVVENDSGGTAGYTVTLGLSSFDNDLEGATLTLMPDDQGLISSTANAQNPPILLGGMASVELEADGLSAATILEGKSVWDNPGHVALGRWGSNFTGDLKVYTNTIRAGASRAVMTWELTIA